MKLLMLCDSQILINEVQNLEAKGYIRYGSTLLSESEVSLFNYYLNRVEFKNGLDLRNEYAHGVQQTSKNEEEHKNNYFLFLRLFFLFVIKINDDFCLKAEQDKKELFEK